MYPINKLPYHVEICGSSFNIETSFTKSIEFANLIADDEMDQVEKLLKILILYYGTVELPDIEEAVEKIIWFYSLGELDSLDSLVNDEEVEERISEEVFDYTYDFGFIYAAFMQQYGIDIFEEEDLHWWKFKYLLQGLNEQTKLVQIMGYRSKKISNDMSKEEKRFYKEMKELYSLPGKKKDRAEDFHDALSALI